MTRFMPEGSASMYHLTSISPVTMVCRYDRVGIISGTFRRAFKAVSIRFGRRRCTEARRGQMARSTASPGATDQKSQLNHQSEIVSARARILHGFGRAKALIASPKFRFVLVLRTEVNGKIQLFRGNYGGRDR